jgi:VIT family
MEKTIWISSLSGPNLKSNQGHPQDALVAALIAGAMSMAAGEYVSVHSQPDTEHADLAQHNIFSQSSNIEQKPLPPQHRLNPKRKEEPTTYADHTRPRPPKCITAACIGIQGSLV